MPHIPRAGLPRSSEASLNAAMEAAEPVFDGPVVELDVREDLKRGEEPFSKIMAGVSTLPDRGVLHLRATFEPVPLFRVLGKQGFEYRSVAHSEDDWSVWFFRAAEHPEVAAPESAPAKPAATSDTATPATATALAAPAANEILLDVRGLEPPEPMMKTLELLETLPEGHVLVQHNERVPQFLLPILAERGFVHEIHTTEDDGVYVRISRG